jgi:hypothetical protein
MQANIQISIDDENSTSQCDDVNSERYLKIGIGFALNGTDYPSADNPNPPLPDNDEQDSSKSAWPWIIGIGVGLIVIIVLILLLRQ